MGCVVRWRWAAVTAAIDVLLCTVSGDNLKVAGAPGVQALREHLTIVVLNAIAALFGVALDHASEPSAFTSYIESEAHACARAEHD